MRLFATLAAYLPPGARGDSVTLEVPEGTTVVQLLQRLAIPAETSALAVVNGHEVDEARPLREGDVVTMFPPLAGGAPLETDAHRPAA